MRVRALLVIGTLFGVAIIAGVRHRKPVRVPPAKIQTEQILKRPVAQFICDGLRFDKTVERLSAETGLRVDVRWDVLHAAGVEKDWPIDLRVLQRDVGRTLDDVLDSASGGNEHLTYRLVDDGRVVITTMADELIVQLHDVHRLLQMEPKVSAAGLIQFLEEEVDPWSWENRAGKLGNMKVVSDQLVCITTKANQTRIQSLLSQFDQPGGGRNDIPKADMIRTRAALERVAGNIEVDSMDLATELERFANRFGLRLVVNWDALAKIGLNRNTPVSMNLRNVRLGKALRILIEWPRDRNESRTISVVQADGSIVVTSRDDEFTRFAIERVYDFRDLISLPEPAPGTRSQGPTREDLYSAIERLITDTVDTDSWAVNGGSATIIRRGMRFYVRQSPENHRQLENLMEQLRAERIPASGPARNRDILIDDGRPPATLD